MFLPIGTVRRRRYVAASVFLLTLALLLGDVAVLAAPRTLIVIVGLRSDLIRSGQRDVLEGRLTVLDHLD